MMGSRTASTESYSINRGAKVVQSKTLAAVTSV